MQDITLSPDTLLLAAAALVVLLLLSVVLAVVIARGRSRKDAAAEAAEQSRIAMELDSRLKHLAESQSTAQAQMAESLRAQERQLAEMVEKRLSDFGQKVGDKLNQTSTDQQKTLTDLRERLAVIDTAQKNITELSTQVVSLQDVLANKQARGAFGEVQLHDLVTAVLPPSAYGFQETLSGGQRADCLLKLPNPPGSIAIDAKFPLESYQQLRDAQDEAARVQAGRLFSQAVRKHVSDIAEKYIVPGETAESALMFLPSEAVYAELHANFRNVVEESFRRRVWIVSPTTLMATLNTVRAVLKDVRMREQAGVIQKEVGVLMEDVGRLDERVQKLQRHFDQATEDVRQIRISTEKIGKRGEKIEELEFDEEQEAEPLDPAPQRLGGAGRS
ncbi:MAG: DNA recombination protein RmuC [Rhodovibrionaceae bacterium]|nr:DNA recombination protein RmuC [Rhodovibrionaceae bacterium]